MGSSKDAATKAKAKPAAKGKAKASPAKGKAKAAAAKGKAPASKATRAAPTKYAPGKKPVAKPSGPPSAAFTSIAAILGQNGGVGTRKMFGAHSLNLGGHAFVMEYEGDLVVRLPAARVTELTAGGTGTPFDPGMGRPSKGWLTVPQGRGDWQRLAEEGLAHVGTLPPK